MAETPASTSPAPRELPAAGDTEPLMYAQQWDLPRTKAQRRYLILSQQRTGSTYLTRRLANLPDRLGLPSEYLGDRAIPRMAPRLLAGLPPKATIPLAQYIRAVESVRTSADGWFGIKVQPHHLMSVCDNKEDVAITFLNQFDRIIIMTRRDMLGQAVSGAIAQQTRVWVTDGREPELDPAQTRQLYAMMVRNISRYMGEETQMASLTRGLTRPYIHVDYSEIERDGQACFERVVAFIDADAARGVQEQAHVPVPRKPEGRVAQAVRAGFLDYIQGRDAA